MQVADALRSAIIKCYYLDVRRLKRRLTFAGVDTLLAELEIKLYNNIFIPGQKTNLTKNEILQTLQEIRNIIIHQHNGLFLHLVNSLINKVEVFGLYFASLDIRQESSVHQNLLNNLAQNNGILPAHYAELSDDDKIALLSMLDKTIDSAAITDPVHSDTIKTIGAIKTIQQYNGVEGCSRYIISQCTSALNAMEVYGLFLLSGWKKEEMNIDIVPLFETIGDLERINGAVLQRAARSQHGGLCERRHHR